MTSKPVIGVTLDAEERGDFSDFPYYVLRKNYIKALEKAGALPVLLPYHPEGVASYLDMIDGLLIPGGNFDIPAHYYGAESEHPTMHTKDARTDFEWRMLQGCLEADKPVLGICGGEQLVGVALGCTLLQHIPDDVPNALEHEVADRLKPAHDITIVESSLLHKIVGMTTLGVNSGHHQAVATAPDSVLISARTSDGVIEAIESKNHRFCLGVEWHPEYEIHAQDSALFTAFVDACQNV